MYNEYFGFSESPFENNLDQRFLFLSEDHREVLAALLYFVKAKKSFALVCGDVGTGKTMLINCFLSRLPKTVQPVIISNPFVNSQDLLLYLTKILNIETGESEGILDLTDKVKNALIAAKDQQRQLVLMVDEAHLLSDQALEEIRLLSNLETPEQKLLQILLVGQYELSYKLDRPEMRHLRQRINVNRFLSHLNSTETIQYIDHRLSQVGSSFALIFEPECQTLIFKMTRGVPRRINQICDNALLISMAEGVRKINPGILKKAEEAVQTDLILTPRSFKGRGSRLKRFFGIRSALAAIAALVVLGMISLYGGPLVKRLRQVCAKEPRLAEILSETKTSSPVLPKLEVSPALAKQEPLSASEEPKVAPQVPLPPKPSASPATNEENLASSEKIALQLSQTSEGKSDSTSPLEPLSAKQGAFTDSTQVMARAGEGLTRLAAKYYPENKKLGLVAMILANPKITNEDVILKGQALYLPAINLSKETIRLKDGLFYAVYGRYNSPDSSAKDASWLIKNRVRFKVMDTKDSDSNVAYRIFLGGYDWKKI